MPTRHEIYVNPVVRARKAYPFVLVMQADIAETGRSRMVAPLVPKSALAPTTGRLSPAVSVAGQPYVALVPTMYPLDVRDLRERVGSAADSAKDLSAALDLLFFGV